MINFENNDIAIAGVDFSINAPAFILLKDNQYIPFCILNGSLPISKKLTDFEKQFCAIHKTEDEYIKNIEFLTDIILNILLQYKIKTVFIEGYSMASNGAYFIQLIEYQSVLRYKLFKNGIKIVPISPKSIKKTAGKGNFNKLEMFNAFCNENNLNFKYDLLNHCNENKENIIIKTKRKATGIIEETGIKKPFEDIVDAYFCLKTGILFENNI